MTLDTDLSELLRRQAQYVRRQQRERVLLVLPRFVEFIQQNAPLRQIIDEIESEYEGHVAEFREADSYFAEAISQAWQEHGGWFLAAWNAAVEAAGPNAHWANAWGGAPTQLEERLATAGQFEIATLDEPNGDPSATGAILASMTHWFACVKDERLSEDTQQRRNEFLELVTHVRLIHEQALRAFQVVAKSHAGASWARLQAFAATLIPPLVPHFPEDGLATIIWKELEVLEHRRIGRAALNLPEQDADDKGNADRYQARVLLDLETVEEELLHRLGLHRSHSALVLRFKTKCERFLAHRLREQIAGETSKPEDLLAAAAAEYLFDQGLNPLFNAQVVKLRPDLFDTTRPYTLYVEAKQYDRSPKTKIERGAWQIWDTWSELDGQHRVREAFLLIFRRGGPLVVFEGPPAKLGERTVHPVVVDISNPENKGSRAKERPVRVSTAALLPRK